MPQDVTEFNATLYFAKQPQLTVTGLVEAWAREGYTCDESPHPNNPRELDDLFQGLRGGTFVNLKMPRPANLQAFTSACPDYPALANTSIDWDSTYCISPKAAWSDLQKARHEIRFQFRTLEDAAQPRRAHNELVATLLGIHQAAPLQAVWFHDLELLVGREDLDEYLSYANSHLEKAKPQFAPMLAIGSFVRQDGSKVTAWSTGLEHFGHDNLWLEELGLAPLDALSLIFNSGYGITGGHRLPAGDSMESRGIHCRIQAATFRGKPALRLQWQRGS